MSDSPDTAVLIVDDNEKNMKLARDALRLAGFETLEDGPAARASRWQPPDCPT